MTSSATTISADRQWNKPYSKPQLDCRQNICIVNYIALKIKFQQCCWIKFTWIGCRIKLYCSILRCFVVIVVGTFCVQKFFRHAHPSNTPFTYPPFLFTFLGSYNSHNISRFSKLPPHVPSFPLYYIVSPHSYLCSLLLNIIRFYASVTLLLAAIIHALCIQY